MIFSFEEKIRKRNVTSSKIKLKFVGQVGLQFQNKNLNCFLGIWVQLVTKSMRNVFTSKYL